MRSENAAEIYASENETKYFGLVVALNTLPVAERGFGGEVEMVV